jgi:hypothetical protein
MSSDLKLFVDFAGNQLLSGVNANPSGYRPRFVLGDTLTVDLHLVELTRNTDFPAVEISTDDLAGASSSTTLAVGSLETVPTSGTFSLTFGANTTSPLSYNVSAAQVSTALNALASVVSAGGVAVAQVGEGYRIAFNSAGVRTAISATTSALVPKASAIVVESTVGTVSAPSVQVVRLRVNPVALLNSWTAVPAASATLTNVRTWDGVNSTVRLTIAEAVGGTFTLGFTEAGPSTVYSAPLLAYDLTASDLVNALQAWDDFAAAGAVSVRQIAASVFDITSTVAPEAGSPVDGWTVDGSGLSSSVGLRGTLSLATVEAETTLDGADSVGVVLEVQVAAAGGAARTVLQISASLVEDLIEGATCVPVEGDTCLGSAEAAEIYATKAEAPTSDELAALHAADDPSAANPFATLADIASGGLAIPANTRLALLAAASPNAGNPILTESGGSALFLDQALNLSDLPSPATARTNLGLGSAAEESAADFAQVANNLSDLASVSVARTNLGLGSAALQPATDFAAVANNLSDLADAPTARTNLGLGSDATGSNLSSLTDPAVARANLGISVTNATDPNLVRLESPDFWAHHHSGAGTAAVVYAGVRYLVGPNGGAAAGHAFGYTVSDPIYSNAIGSFNFGNPLRVAGKCHAPSYAEGTADNTTFRILVGLDDSYQLISGSLLSTLQNLIGFSWVVGSTGGTAAPIKLVVGNTTTGGLTETATGSFADPTLFAAAKRSFAWELIVDPSTTTLTLKIDGTTIGSTTAPSGYSGPNYYTGGNGYVIREEIETFGTNSQKPALYFSTRVVLSS